MSTPLLFSKVNHTFKILNSHIKLPYDAACSISYRCLYSNAHGTIFHDNQKVEMTQMLSKGEWRDKMWHILATRIFFSLNKEGNSPVTTWVNFEDIVLNDVSQPQKHKYSMTVLI